METGVCLVLCTAPDEASAERVVRPLLEERLIACANLLPRARSLYWWRGQVEEASEVVLLMKTAADRVEALRQRLPQLHPYDVPELLMVPVEGGLEPYLAWVVSETRNRSA